MVLILIRRTIAIFVLSLLGFHSASFADANTAGQAGREMEPTPRYAGWRLVAQSDVIATGELEVPVKAIRAAIRAKKLDYFPLKLHIHALVKGQPAVKVLAVQFYPAEYAPSVEAVIASNRRKVLVFLTLSDESKKYYFAGYTPNALQSPKTDVVAKIRDEVANQARIADQFPQSLAAKPDAFDPKVKDLITTMRFPLTQQTAFDQLIELGPKAVPAMVRLMDDRRALGMERMALRNRSPDAFEAYAQYGPALIVDAMSTIAGYVTGENFRFLNNGGSQRERAAEVRAWRVYLFYRVSWQKPTEVHQK